MMPNTNFVDITTDFFGLFDEVGNDFNFNSNLESSSKKCRRSQCYNPRAMKKNGSLHQYCEMHRKEINNKQQTRRAEYHSQRTQSLASGRSNSRHSSSSTCSYVSKKCLEPRAQKKDGGYHTLCEYHRRKGLDRQHLYEIKRQQRNAVLYSSEASLPAGDANYEDDSKFDIELIDLLYENESN